MNYKEGKEIVLSLIDDDYITIEGLVMNLKWDSVFAKDVINQLIKQGHVVNHGGRIFRKEE